MEPSKEMLGIPKYEAQCLSDKQNYRYVNKYNNCHYHQYMIDLFMYIILTENIVNLQKKIILCCLMKVDLENIV